MVNKLMIIITVIVLLGIFFFPKSSTEGPAEGGLHQDIKEYSKKECNCIGIHQWIGGIEKSDDHVCYGIPLCEIICKQRTDLGWKEIPCE